MLDMFMNSLRGAWRMLGVRRPRVPRKHGPRRQSLSFSSAADSKRIVRINSKYGGTGLSPKLREGWEQLKLPHGAKNLGSQCLLMANFNSPDPYPATTDLAFLERVVKWLKEDHGLRITVGASAGIPWLPSRHVLTSLGVVSLTQRLGTELWITDESERWVEVDTPAAGWSVIVPEKLYDFGLVVFLPLMRTHRFATFSQGMKLSMGIIHPWTRKTMHVTQLQRRIAAMASVIQPDLLIVDGRRGFISGGPEMGGLVEPGVVLMGSNQLTLEIQGRYELARAAEQQEEKLAVAPLEAPVVRHGLEFGVSPYDNIEDYDIVDVT
jgi:uncharacterized protein (DUF362 family)